MTCTFLYLNAHDADNVRRRERDRAFERRCRLQSMWVSVASLTVAFALIALIVALA